MTEKTQVRLSGLGGQGVVLAGILLGEAGVLDGKYISGANSYGAQARGSGCKSEIVFSHTPIDFPHLVEVDILVAMNQGAYDLYGGEVKESTGFILYDSGLVKVKEGFKVRQTGIPATEIAVKELKNKQVANIVLLGALVENTGVVSMEAIKRAIHTHVNERYRKLNLKALEAGMVAGRQAHG